MAAPTSVEMCRPVVLIAADAQQVMSALQSAAQHDTSECAEAIEVLEVAMAVASPTTQQARRLADEIDPFIRSRAPDHLTAASAARTLRALAAQVDALTATLAQQTTSSSFAPPAPN